MSKSKPKRGRGRPPAEHPLKKRMFRVDDVSWGLIRLAAQKSGKTVAGWAREKLIRAAKRELG